MTLKPKLTPHAGLHAIIVANADTCTRLWTSIAEASSARQGLAEQTQLVEDLENQLALTESSVEQWERVTNVLREAYEESRDSIFRRTWAKLVSKKAAEDLEDQEDKDEMAYKEALEKLLSERVYRDSLRSRLEEGVIEKQTLEWQVAELEVLQDTLDKTYTRIFKGSSDFPEEVEAEYIFQTAQREVEKATAEVETNDASLKLLSKGYDSMTLAIQDLKDATGYASWSEMEARECLRQASARAETARKLVDDAHNLCPSISPLAQINFRLHSTSSRKFDYKFNKTKQEAFSAYDELKATKRGHEDRTKLSQHSLKFATLDLEQRKSELRELRTGIVKRVIERGSAAFEDLKSPNRQQGGLDPSDGVQTRDEDVGSSSQMERTPAVVSSQRYDDGDEVEAPLSPAPRYSMVFPALPPLSTSIG